MNGMKLWWSIDAVITRITKWALFVSIACIVYIMTIATIDIIATKFFNSPIPSTAEFIENLNILLVFMGMAFVQLERGHIVGPVFEKRFPKAVNKAIALAGYIMGILVCGLVSWGALVLTQDMIAVGHTKKSLIDFPLWPFALCLFVSFAMLAIAYVLSIVRTLARSENDKATDVIQI